MFALAHDEDRARYVPRDTFGGVPHEHVLETGLAVGCESDQIDFAITSSVCDDLKRDSYLDNHILEKLWLHHSASQFLQFFLHGCCGKTSY